MSLGLRVRACLCVFTAGIHPRFRVVTDLLSARGGACLHTVLNCMFCYCCEDLLQHCDARRSCSRAAPPLKGPPGPNLDRFFFVTRPFPLMRPIMHLEGVGPRSGANRPVVYRQTSGGKKNHKSLPLATGPCIPVAGTTP